VNPVNTLLSAGLYSSGELIARNFHYFVPPELLELIENEVVLETVAEEDAILLRLSSDHLAKNVWLNCRVDGFFSDNYFDLLPGSPVEVRFSPRQRRPLTADDFSIRHLGEVTARQSGD
jgi:beta-mannosidase